MGTTAEKLTYLNGTKRLLRRRINSLGGNITLDTRFRDYLLWLNRFYDAAASAFEFEIKGETRLSTNSTSTNLLPLYSGEIVTDGVTVTISDGGKITINGTAERDVYIKITNGIQAIYEDPASNDGHTYYDTYGWLKEKIQEFDPATTVYKQYCHGTGDAVVNEGTSTVVQLTTNTNNMPVFHREGFSNLRDRTNVYDDKDVIGTATCANTKELNCVYIELKQGVQLNQYFWLQVCLTQESTWTPNLDALGPKPDNPMTIESLTGDVTYTSKDGLRDFTVSLGDGSPYRSVPNAGYDSITYKDGKFYNIRKTWDASLSSSNWEHYAQYNGIYRKSFNSINSKSAVCNYFENVVNNAIVDFQTASDNLQHGQFALVEDNGDTYIYIKDTDFTESGDTATQFSNWVDSLYPTNIRVIYVGDESSWIEQEITENWFSTLYPQLNAIKDYEVQCIIEDKVF